MATTFVEYTLDITMAYNGQNGHKGYQKTARCTHTIDASLSSNTRQINKQTIDSYSQTIAPQSTILGYQPEVVKLEGVLCHIDDVEDMLAQTAGHRVINTLYNKFLPCSILWCNSSDIPELMVGQPRSKGYWLVDMFKIKRSKQKPDLILYELILTRWYGWFD